MPSEPRGTVLWNETSKFGDDIRVMEHNNVVELWINGVWQGELRQNDPLSLPTPYMQHMMLSLCYARYTRRFLVIGLGTGCIPKTLHTVFPQAVVHTVEYDADIIYLAERYFQVPTSSHDTTQQRFRIFHDDGFAFIKRPPTRYDVIFIDAFAGSELPLGARDPHLMWSIRQALARGGTFVMNLSRLEPRFNKRIIAATQRLIGPVFLLDPKNNERHDDLNVILLASTYYAKKTFHSRRAFLANYEDIIGLHVDDLIKNIIPSANLRYS